MKPKVIAVAYSDIHLNNWKSHNPHNIRFLQMEDLIKDIANTARRYSVPILFLGDKFHNPNSLENFIIGKSLGWYKKHMVGISNIEISGNHDMSEKNTYEQRSPSYIEMFSVLPDFKNCDFNTVKLSNEVMVHGIPYLNGNNGLAKALDERRKFFIPGKKNILMLHTDMPGARDTDGRVVESSEGIPLEMGKFFRGFDLVLSGHIHRAQKLASNVYMLGATHQQRSSDRDNTMGYYLIMDDLTLKFIEVRFLPQFKELEEGLPLPDNFNFYISMPKAQEKTEEVKMVFSNKLNKAILASKYLKVKGIKSKSKKQALTKALKKLEK